MSVATINNIKCRFFVHSEEGFEGASKGATVIVPEQSGQNIFLDGSVFMLLPNGIAVRLNRVTRDDVLTLLVSGQWIELDRPQHEGGTPIKVYQQIK